MTRPTDPLFDQRIADWLEADPDHAPAQALDVVLAAIPSVRQRRLAPWRFPTMTMPVRLATAALIGALVLGGAFLLTGGGSKPSTAVPTTVAPSWTAAASLGTARVDFATALLADGRILVTGGTNAAGDLASAEIYDPATLTWTTTSPVSQGGGLHTLTRLKDGRVLAVGGGQDTELYDPATGAWTATGRLTFGRGQHMAALLSDGRVLVAGGTEDGAVAAELYDPTTGRWSLTGLMTQWRASSSMTVLADGTVLVAGGFIRQALGGTATAEIYDPRTGNWTQTATMATARNGAQTGTLLDDGRVLVTGGGGATPELYDPAKRAWTSTVPVGTSAGETATLLRDGRVLIAGGLGPNDVDAVTTVEIFDPVAGTWSATAAMSDARLSGGASLLPDGRVMVFGGSTTGPGGAYRSSSEVYSPGTP